MNNIYLELCGVGGVLGVATGIIHLRRAAYEMTINESGDLRWKSLFAHGSIKIATIASVRRHRMRKLQYFFDCSNGTSISFILSRRSDPTTNFFNILKHENGQINFEVLYDAQRLGWPGLSR